MCKKIITAAAVLAIAAGAYFTGSVVAHSQDARSQHQLMGAIVGGQTIGIDGNVYEARPCLGMYGNGPGPAHWQFTCR